MNFPHKKRFKTFSAGKETSFYLSKSMFEHVHGQFYNYIPKQDLRSSIFKSNPVPRCQVTNGKALVKTQPKFLRVIGLLTNLLSVIDRALNSNRYVVKVKKPG